MKRVNVLSFVLAAWFFPCSTFQAAAGEDLPPLGYDALLQIDKLPLLADWPAHQDSSYSRKNDNADEGNFLRVEPNGEQVMVDTDGPGVITRIWSTGIVGRQMSDRCRFLFYFDGERKARLDLSVPELFGAKGSKYPFVPPLSVTFESGAAGNPREGPANLCYVPIPFQKHLKVTGRNVAYYHVDYLRVPVSASLPSWSQTWADSQKEKHGRVAALFNQVGQDPKPRPASNPESGIAFKIEPGKSLIQSLRGTGMIGALWIRIRKPTPRVLRGVVLAITFDGANGPSVLTPIGDFFGSGCGDRRFKSLLTGMTEEGYYSFWPMPYAKSATLEIRNETKEAVILDRLNINAHALPRWPANMGYFHARYGQNKDCEFHQDYTILKVERHRGKYVGVNVTMQNARGGEGIFFLEGDEKIYCDGEQWPSRWLGTGTEDYYNGAYFWNHPDKAAMVRPLGGPTFLDWGIGRVCAFRWQIPDCVNFAKSIRVDQEHGPVSDIPTNYQSVAYYYLDKPTTQTRFPEMSDRLPVTPVGATPIVMGCSLNGIPTRNGQPLSKRTFHDACPEVEASNDGQLFGATHPGDAIDASLTVPGEEVYQGELFLSAGPEYGTVDVFLNEKHLATIDCYRPEFIPWISFNLGKTRINAGQQHLRLAVSGKNPAASDSHLGFVSIQLHPTSPLIGVWSAVGTWPCPREGGWEKVYPPEKNQRLDAVYQTPAIGPVKWKKCHKTTVTFEGDWRVGFGLTYVWCPNDRPVTFFFGKDDALKVWLNDKVVFDLNTWSHLVPDANFCSSTLKKGWNKILVKNGNWTGGFGYCMRLSDPDGVLKYARTPKN